MLFDADFCSKPNQTVKHPDKSRLAPLKTVKPVARMLKLFITIIMYYIRFVLVIRWFRTRGRHKLKYFTDAKCEVSAVSVYEIFCLRRK